MTRGNFPLDTPAGNIRTWLLVLVPLTYWAVLYPFAWQSAPVLAGRFDVWIYLAALWVMGAGWRSARLLCRGAHVLRNSLSPMRLREDWQKRVVGELVWHLGPALFGTGLLYALPSSLRNPVVAMVALVCAFLAALVSGLYSYGYWFGDSSRSQGPSSAGHLARGAEWRRRVQHYLQRYSNLELAQESAQKGQMPHQKWVRNWVYPVLPIAAWTMFPYRVSWGEDVGLAHVVFIAFAVSASGPLLMFQDLHWRYLLLPGGNQRGGFGRRIFMSTMKYQATVWSGSLMGYWYFKSLWNQESLSEVVLQGVLNNAMIAFEFTAVCAVTVAVRAMGRVYLFLLPWSIAIGAAIYLAAVHGRWSNPVIFSAGPTYIVILLSITVLAVLLADRVWTTRKLMPQML